MPTSEQFDTYQPVRLPRPRPPRTAPHRPRSSRRTVFKRLFLVAAVIVFGVVLFSVENAAILLTNLTATMVAPSIPQPRQASQPPSDSGESSIAKSEPIESEDRISRLVDPARASVEVATSETLLMQFEAWAAERDAQQLTAEQSAQHRSSPKTVADRAVEATTGLAATVQKDRVSRSIRKVRPKVSLQQPPKQVDQLKNARVRAPPSQRNEAKFSQASAGK
jgi:hypothetical protein